MRSWFSSAGPNHSHPFRQPTPSIRPLLEPLEDRCLPSTMSMSVNPSGALPPVSTSTAGNTVASLSHDQIHSLQDQSQQQTENAIIRLEIERAVLGILQLFAAQVPQFQPEIAFLSNAIPAQQATVNSLQNQTNLLNELDDLQDQVILLTAQIQNASAVIPTLLQHGDVQSVNTLQSIIALDQAAVQALQPQITAVEVEVSAFV